MASSSLLLASASLLSEALVKSSPIQIDSDNRLTRLKNIIEINKKLPDNGEDSESDEPDMFMEKSNFSQPQQNVGYNAPNEMPPQI